MNLRYLLVLALAGTGGIVPAWADAAEPLRLQTAVDRALASHPSLRAESAQLRAAQARAEREALPPPYVFGGDLENFAGSGSLNGVESAETTLRIGRVIELGGKRDARRALGSAEIDLQEGVAAAARIDVASRTATRFIEVLADQERLRFARERVEQAEATRRVVANWVAAARNPESDLRAAEIAVAEAELELEHAGHELAAARTTLAASWGAMAPDFEEVTGDFQALPDVADLDTLVARLPQTIEQRTAVLLGRTLEARRRVAESSAKPDVNVSLGVRRLEALGDQGLVMSFSVPLGSRPRASLAIAEVDAQLDAVQARIEAQRYETHQALFEKYQELSHAGIEAAALRGRLIPKAEQALAFTRRGFEAGRYSYLSLAQAQTTLFELRGRSVEAAARYHSLLVEVERLTAVAMDTSP